MPSTFPKNSTNSSFNVPRKMSIRIEINEIVYKKNLIDTEWKNLYGNLKISLANFSTPSISDALHRSDDSEFGRIAYTIAILLMFSTVILLLMVRTIRRENSEFEASRAMK